MHGIMCNLIVWELKGYFISQLDVSQIEARRKQNNSANKINECDVVYCLYSMMKCVIN
jgi:hypothetical protein